MHWGWLCSLLSTHLWGRFSEESQRFGGVKDLKCSVFLPSGFRDEIKAQREKRYTNSCLKFQNLIDLSIKGKKVYILDFSGQTASVETTQLCPCRANEAGQKK